MEKQITKVLRFEGAGWSGADHNGVGNCRIRTTFKNLKGDTVYFELTGHRSTIHSPPSMQKYDVPWHIWHLHIVDTETGKRSENKRLRIHSGDAWKTTKEYTQQNIVAFVNSAMSCDFDSMEVLNEGWSGFDVDGKEA